MHAITIDHLTVRFQNQVILDDITFSIQEQAIVALIGPNGSGKTTLLKAILGLIPYEGQVRVFGKESKKVLARIGYVPQHVYFDRTFPITVEEFLALSWSEQNPARFDQVLSEIDMELRRKHMIGTLSDGQLQRVLIGRAILHDPDILLLDEPTSGIDIEGVRDFYTLIGHMNKIHKTTILMISHEINMVYKFADQILCLNRNLVCQGSPEIALTKEVLRKLYGEHVDFREHTH